LRILVIFDKERKAVAVVEVKYWFLVISKNALNPPLKREVGINHSKVVEIRMRRLDNMFRK